MRVYLLLLDVVKDSIVLFLLLNGGFELVPLSLHALVQELQLLNFALKVCHV